jgi:aspartyl/glutamyl-tRNA(Asn/Gln) amidotransferase C subunit
MNIEDVTHLAKLARIHMSEDEKVAFIPEAESILEYVNHIQTLSLGEREAAVPLHPNPLRDDTSRPFEGASSDDIIAAFPTRDGRHNVVKKILSNDNS